MKFSKLKFITQEYSLRLLSVATIFCAVNLALPALAQEEPEEQEEEIAKDASTEINVKNADIAAIIRIFSKKTKRNYILDERVKGKVSIYLPGKVSSEDAIRILDSVLALKGFTAVPIGDNLWKIIAAREAKQTTIPTIEESEGRGSPTIVTRVVTLKYVGADEVKQLFSPLISGDGLMNAYTGTNSLIIIDSEDNINRILELIEAVDIPFTDQEMSIIPIQYAEATDIAEKIGDILGGGDGDKDNANTARGRLNNANLANRNDPAAVNASSNPALTVSARAREPKIIADERTNSVILVADEDTTARIRALVSQLDSPVDLSGNRFYVYRCQHANAEELAEVLSGLAGGNGSSSSSSSSSSTANALGTNTNSRNRGNQFQSTQNRLSNQKRTPGRSRTENSGDSSGVSSANIGDNISITADPATNSLVINASKTDYEKIRELLKQLDVPRRQVLVEAMLLEVGVSDNTKLGTDWITSAGGKDGGIVALNNSGQLTSLLQDPTKISDFSVAAASAGSLKLPNGITIPTQTLLLQAANSNSNVNVLSAPNILATDNQQAEIVVGQNVPFLASQSSNATNLNNTFNQIDRQDVGITLRITPQISSSDFVTLQIFTEVSNVIATGDLGPTTTVRTSETTVVTKNNQMIVTGGLMSDNISQSKTGVPFLKDIPVLGQLFNRSNEDQIRTNLLIFITPRIIRDQFDARESTVRHRTSLEGAMEEYDVYPRRNEVLHSDDIDSVVEPMIYEGEKPTTIRPPKGNPIKSELTKDIKISDHSVNVKVNPRLPESKAGLPAKTNTGSPSTPKITISRLEVEPRMRMQGGTFVVLQGDVKSSGSSTNLPFAVNSQNKAVGIRIPEGSSSSAKSFFKQGNSYKYLSGSQSLNFKVLGVYDTSVDANNAVKNIENNWHTLTPHELMTLGKGPWKQG